MMDADTQTSATRRRRASTERTMDEIMDMARSLPLTRQVLAGSIEEATPTQPGFMASWMRAEPGSRERSKRTRLPGQAGLPATKEPGRIRLDPGALPGGLRPRVPRIPRFRRPQRGRGPVRPARHRQDPPGDRIGAQGMHRGHPGKVLHRGRPGRAPAARLPDGKLDKELAQISKASLLAGDELGYVPVDEQGSRLLFQAVANAYERQSVIHATNIESGGWGRVFGDADMATAIVDRTVHHGRMIRFEGESYRRAHALMG